MTIKRSIDDETCFSHFAGVLVDDAVLALENYEVRPGSTVITIKSAYLETMSTRKHAVVASFNDGKAETSLTINAAGSSKVPGGNTGDPNRPKVWIGILIAAAAAVVLLFVLLRRKKKF